MKQSEAYVGQEVWHETDNNGPILRGKIIRLHDDCASVEWDDGRAMMWPLASLDFDDEPFEPPTVNNEVV